MLKLGENVNTFLSKPLPTSPDAERGVIGGILAKPSSFDEISTFLHTSDFNDPVCRDCYEAIRKCSEIGEEINVVTTYMHLVVLKSPVNSVQLSDLVQNAVVNGAVTLARKVKELSDRRRVIQASVALLEGAMDVSTDVSESANEAARLVDSVLSGRVSGGQQDIGDIVADIVRRAENGEHVKRILTPYRQLDDITGGLQAGEMVTLAGRPGTGKTALALNIVSGAMYSRLKVGVFSLEMSQRSLAERMCAASMGIDAQIFRTRKFQPEHIKKLKDFHLGLHGLQTKVFDSPRVDPDTIRAECRKWKRTIGLDLAVIDYLQLVQSQSSRKESSREREVAEISRSVKQLAIELDIPVLLLAQLNRAVENREDKTPRLSDLRESGSIEQDSDMVWFLSPWDTASSELDVVNVKLSVAKSRSSSTGSVALQYHRRFLRFEGV
jgi:replicative DNA helicase